MTSAPALATFDVVVVGAGPAGLASAIFARLAGYAVALCDPGEDVQDKACGEGLMPAGLGVLGRLGVSLPTGASAPLTGVRYHDGPTAATATLGPEGGRGVARTVLTASLSQRAAALGVRRFRARLRALTTTATGVDLQLAGTPEASATSCAPSTPEQLAARYLIGADGLHSTVRRLAGLQARPRRGGALLPRYGLRRHYAGAPWSNFVEVHLAPDSEAYVTPLGPHQFNVAVLTRAPRRGWAACLADFPALVHRLAGAAAGPVRGAGPFAQRASACAQGRVLLVGDAAGYLDALTGEGVSLALLSAERAVAALAAAQPAGTYRRAWAPLYAHYARHAGLLLALGRWPRLRRLLLQALALAPGVMAWWVRRATILPGPRQKQAANGGRHWQPKA